MASTATQIANIMTNNGKTAADMTHALKLLGNGNMQNGLARISEYYSTEVKYAKGKGLTRGRYQGTAIGIVGTIAVIKLIQEVKKDHAAKLIHESEGRTILKTVETAKAPDIDTDSSKTENPAEVQST